MGKIKSDKLRHIEVVLMMTQDTERLSSLTYNICHDFFYVKLSVMSKLRDMDMNDLQSAVGGIVSKNIISINQAFQNVYNIMK